MSDRFSTISAILVVAVLQAGPLAARSGRLVSGPMLGAIDHREARLWLEVAGANELAVEWWAEASPSEVRRRTQPAPPPHLADGQVATLVLGPLLPGTVYSYRLQVDGVEVARDRPRRFATPPLWEWRAGPPDVRFLAGSCMYVNDELYERPGAPYADEMGIFDVMAGRGAEAMLWLGDNVYLREADFGSATGIWARWHHDRAHPALQRFLASTAHYAMWDDHDFGPNDSDKSFPLAATALEAFEAYWANPTYGTLDTRGAFTSFKRGDVSFFLTDGRLYRDIRTLDPAETDHKSQLGRAQLEWLKTALLYADADFGSRSTFKIVAFGSQFIHNHDRESARHYEAERRELIEFIERHEIGGVVFLAGDRHLSMVAEREREGGRYPLWEITCSPLTAGVVPKDDWEQRVEARAADVVRGSNVHERSFCELLAHGPSDDRRLSVEIKGSDGGVRFATELRAKDLGVSRDADRRTSR